MGDELDAEDYDRGSGYRAREEIGQHELADGLTSLQLLGGDPFMRMQATNLALVDEFIMQLETETLTTLLAEERTPGIAFFLSAQSQMWIFAAYELLRTWRQRAREAIRLCNEGKLQEEIATLRKDRGYRHYGQELKADQLEKIIRDDSIVEKLREDMRVVYFPFFHLEHIRIALAKHEVPGNKSIAAYAPGYGRINNECGSLDYELENDGIILGRVSRRDIAESLRALLDRSNIPAADEIEVHRKMIRDLPKAAKEARKTFSQKDTR
jgi:hypothetical protein